MGYYTDFSLKVESPLGSIADRNKIEEINKFFKQWKEKKGYPPFYLRDNGTSFSSKDSCKWYRWKDEMKEISQAFPEFYFHLHGEGEETEDIWDATFKNGKIHYRVAEI